MNAPLLPQSPALRLDALTINAGIIILKARAVAQSVACPECGGIAHRIHSRYQRTLLDLPWQGQTVRIELATRKFFCDDPQCKKRIFAEPLPQIAARYARKTERLTQALRELAFLVGGEAAAKIARTFGLLISADSLLDGLKKETLPPFPTPRVLGIDDFAFKKGQHYGTILVDLERRYPVDLLPDRDSGTVERWLKEHPGSQIVSRDRASCYAQGIRSGAPGAVQVTDRWHLFKNIGDALERLLLRKHRLLREITLRETPEPQPAMPPMPSRRAGEEKIQRKERRLACYERIVSLHEQGVNILGIQRLTGADRKTIRKYLSSGALPERQPRPDRAGKLTPFQTHLAQRWSEGCHNGADLIAEIRSMGYGGGYSILKAFLLSLRVRAPSSATGRKVCAPSPRRLSWLVTNRGHPRARAEDIVLLDKLAFGVRLPLISASRT